MYNNPDYSVKLGHTVDKGFESDTVFPFIYTMVPFENDNWEAVKGGGTAANLTGIGPFVGPGATVTFPVNLEPDYLFKLLWIKYTVYARVTHIAFANPLYIWYDTTPFFFEEQFDYQTSIGTSLIRDLRITVSFQGPDGRILYGGANLNAQQNLGGSRLPLPIAAVQGYDFGSGQIKTPYLLPRLATIMFELTNNDAVRTLVVGAAIYGMKVRL